MNEKEAVYTIDLLLFLHLHCLVAVDKSDPDDDTAELMLLSIEHLHHHIVLLHKLQGLPTLPSDESLADIERLAAKANKTEQSYLHIVPNPKDRGDN